MKRRQVFDLLEESRIDSLNRWQIYWNQTDKDMVFRIRTADEDGKFRSLSHASVNFRCQENVRVKTLAVSSQPWRDYKREDVDTVRRRVGNLVITRGAIAPAGFARDVAAHTLTSSCVKKTAGR